MQGLTFITAFYWDRDDESQAWSKRFFELHKRMPTMAHAAIFSAVRHYLGAIEAAGTDQAKAVIAKMREIPVFAPRTGGYAKTAAWCTTCTSCRCTRRSEIRAATAAIRRS
jgi:ABC-type branched-subunit amino acid transport system substrate-binding protein